MKLTALFAALMAAPVVAQQHVLESPLTGAIEPLNDLSLDVELSDEVTQKLASPLFELHKQLIEIPSISKNETAVSRFLQSYLSQRGYTLELIGDSNRQNIYAYKGSSRDVKVLLTSHIDTVPPYIPYHIEGNEIHGRGAVDAKSCVAAQITALEELLQNQEVDSEDVGLLYVVGEEISGDGGMRLVDSEIDGKWTAAIFGEPTELKLGVGHKGFATVRIAVHGKAAHSGYPELGISATNILIEALYELKHLELPQSKLLGPTTLNIAQIDAGIAANIVPANATAVITIRIADGLDKVEELVTSVLDKYERLEYTFDGRPPQLLDYKVDGFESIILAYSTDVPYLTGDFKRYLYGPGSIHVAHAPNEFVTFEDLEASVEGFKKLVKHALQ